METLKVDWAGPFSWPGYEQANSLPRLPKSSGVYLQTFPYQDGYLIYGAGITRRPVIQRFWEHNRHYLAGEYTVLDVDAAHQGLRKEVWHGWTYAKTHRHEFEANKEAILAAARRQLAGFRLFVGDPGNDRRILERIEAAVMSLLYQQSTPLCDFPDKGMHLAPRWKVEPPLMLNNRCAAVLHGMPAQFIV